ncbi:trypsin beta-like [Venturia canescens]|uniref:trypsin beta-like n=1 Tax=Venturia canescens TaxID=32260 RepID=UPI001C9CF9BB|nr:trypsin beta-like [Venturia canescens]
MGIHGIVILFALVVLGGKLEVGGHPSEKLLVRGARMVNGTKMTIEDAPWFVFLMGEYDHFHKGFASCSGSIISSYWVMTVAHCACSTVPRMKIKFVLAGSDFYSEQYIIGAKYNEDTKGYRHKIDKTICHPHWNAAHQGIHDIALVHVIEPFKFNETLQLILNHQDRRIFAETQAIAFGWDHSVQNSERFGRVLNFAKMKITPTNTCDFFRATIHGRRTPPPGQLCADPVSGKPNSGDSGGPLVFEGILVGIYSWRYIFNNSKWPFGFVDVACYYDWILGNICDDVPDILSPCGY